MAKTASLTLQGDVLAVQPYRGEPGRDPGAGRAYVLEVVDEAACSTLLASLPLLDRLLAEKIAAVREDRMEEVVDFMAARMLAPSAVDLAMAQRLAHRHARILNEFGYFSAEQLADANGSQASNRTALADNWRKRRQVFAVPHPDKAARDRDVHPAFQFENGKPIKAVQEVLEAFGGRKAPWKAGAVVQLEQRCSAWQRAPGGSADQRSGRGRAGGAARRRGERGLSCRAPVPPLDPLFDRWPAGRVIHVIHDTAFVPESFDPGVGGLLWSSRQRDRDHALVLFGDRMDGVLSGRRIGGPLARNAALRDAVLAATLRAGIEAD